jgi:hypothetical protein
VAWARSKKPAKRVELNICYRNEAGEICPPNAKQAIAHASPAEHIFYGGAAGGGKSRWLLVSVLTFAALNAGVECALFRRRRTELERSLIPQALAMLPRDGIAYNGQLGKLEFKHNGSIVWFLHCAARPGRHHPPVGQLEEARDRRGVAHDAAPGRLPDVARARQRRAGPGAARLEPGRPWARLAEAALRRAGGLEVGPRPSPKPFEVWRPYPPKDDPTRYMASRVFIPALYSDNTEMLRFDPNYLERSVLPIGGAQARQLAYGDWDINDGMMFGPDWLAEHIVKPHDARCSRSGSRRSRSSRGTSFRPGAVAADARRNDLRLDRLRLRRALVVPPARHSTRRPHPDVLRVLPGRRARP